MTPQSDRRHSATDPSYTAAFKPKVCTTAIGCELLSATVTLLSPGVKLWILVYTRLHLVTLYFRFRVSKPQRPPQQSSSSSSTIEDNSTSFFEHHQSIEEQPNESRYPQRDGTNGLQRESLTGSTRQSTSTRTKRIGARTFLALIHARQDMPSNTSPGTVFQHRFSDRQQQRILHV